jgi:hypothetical protein
MVRFIETIGIAAGKDLLNPLATVGSYEEPPGRLEDRTTVRGGRSCRHCASVNLTPKLWYLSAKPLAFANPSTMLSNLSAKL